MKTKLTLTLDKDIVNKVKDIASAEGKSLSEIIENYLMFLVYNQPDDIIETLSPRVKQLKGIIKVDEDFDYKVVLDSERTKYHLK